MKQNASVLLLVLFAIVLAGCASHANVAAPVSIVVTTEGSVDPAEAARLRSIVSDAIQRWVHDGKPITVAIALAPATVRQDPLGGTSSKYGPTFMQEIVATYTIRDKDGFVLDWDTFRYPVTEVSYSRLQSMQGTADYIANRIVRLKL